jgi:hypothetical protein
MRMKMSPPCYPDGIRGLRGMRPHFQPLASPGKSVTPDRWKRVYTYIAGS